MKDSVPTLSGPRTTPVGVARLDRYGARMSSGVEILADPTSSPSSRSCNAGISALMESSSVTNCRTGGRSEPALARMTRARGLATRR